MRLEDQLAQLGVRPPETVSEGVLLGTGLADGYRRFDSPIGPVIVTFNPTGVSSVDLDDGAAPERFAARFGRPLIPADPPRGWIRRIERAIERGAPADLPVDLRSVTHFQREVLLQAARIPKSQVRPYVWLAHQVGRPGAVRAVGSTMARNPVPLIIPCHRVVRADGAIGAYSLGGPENKQRLLQHEGTDPEWLEALARRGVRYLGSETTHIFCHPTCANARRIADRHRRELRDRLDATQAGYRPCEVCQPV
ncbi:MAG TPA: methylated-DNA--[protein]-cysteine S-methyltransferase [Acidimicrobiia bacterium]|nr:methylated-DNA--[protein]-cysteine S-methyltransferase [Acidimicrobiia bacterium]